MLDFPKTITIDACEKFMKKLQNKGKESLQLPVETTSLAFGGTASAIQAINTWVRNNEQRELLLRQSDKIDVLDEINNRLHKFTAAMCARTIALTESPSISLRDDINLNAKKIIEKQGTNLYGQQRGGLCWFAFVDHSSKAYDRNFYIEKAGNNAEPRQQEQFQVVIKAMVDKSMEAPGGAKPLSGDKLESLGRIFYELFLNTHEHGRRGVVRSELLRPSIRILYVQGLNLDKVGSSKITKNQPALQSYVDSVEFNGMKNKKRFVELGIVDSGLGYCGRWLADHPQYEPNYNPTLDEEYQIFKKCFQFRQTSTQRDYKGNGLPAVMEKLTMLGGYIRIRSGRLALYRNFIEFPYQADDSCIFYDWEKGLSAEIDLTEMPQSSGVSITLLIPLEAKS